MDNALLIGRACTGVYSVSKIYTTLISLADSAESQRGRRTRRTDTNVLAVKFNTLTGPSHVHTGDRVVCCNPQCTSILSHLSKVEGGTQDQKVGGCPGAV